MGSIFGMFFVVAIVIFVISAFSIVIAGARVSRIAGKVLDAAEKEAEVEIYRRGEAQGLAELTQETVRCAYCSAPIGAPTAAGPNCPSCGAPLP